jgi:hypothetical protein
MIAPSVCRQSTKLEGASKRQCPQARTNQVLTYYIFTYASIAELQLAARNLKGEHSRQGYFSVPNAALKDR